jgi:hypothetical protein
VDCCGRCSLGDEILLSPIPHKVDLKVTMGVVAMDSLRNPFTHFADGSTAFRTKGVALGQDQVIQLNFCRNCFNGEDVEWKRRIVNM